MVKDKDGTELLVIRGSGDRKSKWVCQSSADLLHLLLSLQDQYTKETGKKLRTTGMETSKSSGRTQSDEEDKEDEDAATPIKTDDAAAPAEDEKLMTRMEEDNLRLLMESHRVGLDDILIFRDQLRQEEGLLEEANIYAAIAGDELVYSLLTRLRCLPIHAVLPLPLAFYACC